MQATLGRFGRIRWTGIVSAIILLLLYIPQDEAPLLYQGMLLNSILSNPESPLFSVFQFHICYTSWGGVMLSAVGLKTIGTAGAGMLLRSIHLAFLIYIFLQIERRIKPENILLLWGLLPLFFASYIYSKGFYNFLFALDLSVIALLLRGNGFKENFVFASLLTIGSFCHPLPLLLSIPAMIVLKKFSKLLLMVPACIPLALHLLNTHGITHWEGYQFSGRLYIFLTGLSLDSAHIYEFLFSMPLFLGTYILWLLKGTLKDNSITLLPILFVILGMIAPTETAGGGLIPERLFWISWMLMSIILLQQISMQKFQKYTYIFLWLFIGFKIMLGIITTQTYNQSCGIGKEAAPSGISVRLWSAENPDRARGWLLPFSTFPYRSMALTQHQTDFQNHFAWYGYYPFTYRSNFLRNELYHAEQMDKIKYSRVKYIWSDVAFADPSISLLERCSENPIKLYHIER